MTNKDKARLGASGVLFVAALAAAMFVPHPPRSETGSPIPPAPVAEASAEPVFPRFRRELIDIPKSERPRTILIEPRPGDLIALFHNGRRHGCFVVLQYEPNALALMPSADCGRPAR